MGWSKAGDGHTSSKQPHNSELPFALPSTPACKVSAAKQHLELLLLKQSVPTKTPLLLPFCALSMQQQAGLCSHHMHVQLLLWRTEERKRHICMGKTGSVCRMLLEVPIIQSFPLKLPELDHLEIGRFISEMFWCLLQSAQMLSKWVIVYDCVFLNHWD